MRLKTLRKERPAFENEGAVISGSRMDLSNSEFKPLKHRSNTTFVLPTSLSGDVSSLVISPSEPNLENNLTHSQQTVVNNQRFLNGVTPAQSTQLSSYQAIEAAYREHGIRIHLNPSTAANVSQQQQTLSTENLTGRKSASSIQRVRPFVHRAASRSSSALNYSRIPQDINDDSRPFSALQQPSTVDFTPTITHNSSYAQTSVHAHPSQINNQSATSSILTSEQSDHVVLPLQLANTGESTTAISSLIQNDPDLAYMSSLLQTTSGDSFRDTIRRRAGLRATFAIHRHAQLNASSTNSRIYDKPPSIVSPTTNNRSSVLRSTTIAVAPTVSLPPPSKVEKDILKHATRIRTHHIQNAYIRQQASLRSQMTEHLPQHSTSPTRYSPQNHRTKLIKPSKSITLEPLELILAPSSPSPANTRSMSLYDCSNVKQISQEITPKRSKSPKICFVENQQTRSTNLFLTSLLLNDENLSPTKTSSSDLVSNEKPMTHQQSNSSDSGYYDRCSSSADTQSYISSAINPTSSTVLSARLTSASTRRSNISKKVSFEDQSSTVIITTATYV